MEKEDSERLGVTDTPRKRLCRFSVESLRRMIAEMTEEEVEEFGDLRKPEDIKVVIIRK